MDDKELLPLKPVDASTVFCGGEVDTGKADHETPVLSSGEKTPEDNEIENDDGPLSGAAIEAPIDIDLDSDGSLKLPLALGNSGVYVTEESVEYNEGSS